MITLSACVMAHPSRRLQARALAEQLGAMIVLDPDPDTPGAWSCAKRCWMMGRRTRQTHRLVIQDDAIPLAPIINLAPKLISQHPESMISLYLGDRHAGANRLREEARRCERWHELQHDHFIPTIALIMPTQVGVAMASWPLADTMNPRYDDEIVGAYRTHMNITAYATIPCLVDHDNRQPSLLHPEHGWRSSCCPAETYRGDRWWESGS